MEIKEPSCKEPKGAERMTEERRNQIMWEMGKQMAMNGTIHRIPTMREELPLLAQKIGVPLEDVQEVARLLFDEA